MGLQLSSSPWGFLCTPGSFPCGSAQFWSAVPAAAQTPVCGSACLPSLFLTSKANFNLNVFI